MVAFDTNHLLRHLLEDDESQTRRVREILNGEFTKKRRVMLLDLVLAETAWALKTVYDFDRCALTEVMREVVADKAFCFENTSRLEAAISRHEKGRADFPDYLIDETAKSYHRRLETFDKKLIKG